MYKIEPLCFAMLPPPNLTDGLIKSHKRTIQLLIGIPVARPFWLFSTDQDEEHASRNLSVFFSWYLLNVLPQRICECDDGRPRTEVLFFVDRLKTGRANELANACFINLLHGITEVTHNWQTLRLTHRIKGFYNPWKCVLGLVNKDVGELLPNNPSKERFC